MNVPYPKVLADIHGKTLIEYAVETHELVGAERVIVVTGYKGELVRETLGDRVEYVQQAEQLGTGHAAQQAETLLRDWNGAVLITMGDMPFLTEEMLRSVLDAMQDDVTCVALGANWPEDRELPAWGRFLQAEDGSLAGIVEDKDATDEQKLIRELNASVYAVRAQDLFNVLSKIENNNAQEEYYLTDIVKIFVEEGKKVVRVLTDDVDHVVGINAPEQLEEARELHVHKGLGDEQNA